MDNSDEVFHLSPRASSDRAGTTSTAWTGRLSGVTGKLESDDETLPEELPVELRMSAQSRRVVSSSCSNDILFAVRGGEVDSE